MKYPTNLSESDRHWYDIIQQCRTSGKSDRRGLLENNIGSPTFYYHVKQLRKKACEIPENSYNRVSHPQEIVPLVLEEMPLSKSRSVILESDALSNEIALRLTVQGVTLEVTNQATQELIQNVIAALQYSC